MSKIDGTIVIEPRQGKINVKVKAGDTDAGFATCRTWSQAKAVTAALVEGLFFELTQQQRERQAAQEKTE